jgi:hypothetical protein
MNRSAAPEDPCLNPDNGVSRRRVDQWVANSLMNLFHAGCHPGVHQVCPAGLCLPVAVTQAHWTLRGDSNGALAQPGLDGLARRLLLATPWT